jgi:NAD(P)H-dependent FMN reductase
VNIVGISGSLRAGSSNAALLRAAAALAPAGMSIALYEDLGRLPHFNPDLDGEGAVAPDEVARLRALLREADGVIFCCPEYAHGVPGSLKNALDWLVSYGPVAGKPALSFNASPAGGQRGQASLLQTLRVMSFDVLEEASLTRPFLRQKPDGRPLDEEAAGALRTSLRALAERIRAR